MALPLIPIALALAQFAPQIMRYLGAGEGSAATVEKVVGIAQTVAGSGSPQEALERIRASAELQVRFQEKVLEASTELEKAYLADRQDARARDVEIRKITGGTNARADIMVAGAVLGLVACLAVLALFRDKVPGEVVGIVSTIAGIFGACLRDAFQFEFGSSRGSKEKDAALVKWVDES